MKGNNLNDVKEVDRQVVYECIWSHKAVTMTNIAYMIHLSHPVVTSLVQEMTAGNLVVESGYGISNGGRNPVLYRTNAGTAYAMGIDPEFPKVRMAISNLEYGNTYFSVHVYPRDSDRDQMTRLLKQQMDDLVQDSGIDRSRFLGIGMGIPGVIDYRQSHPVLFERIEGWENVPTGDIIQRYVSKPVYICNDANLLSWAEKEAVHLEDVQNMLHVVIRSRIGVAIWANGSLIQGETGNSGCIGRTTVDKNRLGCKCGSRGCPGPYTSEKAMVRIYSGLAGKEIKQVEDLVPLAENEDRAVLQVFETCGRHPGIGIVNVASLFDISKVVVSASFDVSYIPRSARYTLDVRRVNIMRRKTKVRGGSLAESGLGLGGCLLVLDKEYMSLLKG